MSVETATNPAEETEVTSTEVANEPAETPAEGHEADGESTETVEAPAVVEDETEEVDWEGKKHRVPKELKEALMRQADYTRKTQEVAEQRRQAEARAAELEEQRKQFDEQAKAQQANIKEVARLVNMDEQIEQYTKLDWAKLWQEEPQRAGMLTSQFQALQATRNNLAFQLGQKEQQRVAEERQKAFQKQQESERTAARQREEAETVLRRDIPNWSPETRDKLRDFAIAKVGLKAEEIANITDPRVVKVLHLAYLGDQLSQKQRQATKPAQPVANPVPQVTSRSAAPAAKDPEKMNPDEWLAWREKQVAAKNAANMPFRPRNR
jgi:hypothetical protein